MIKSKGNCYKIIDYTWWVFIIDDKANKYRCNLYPAVVISKEYWFIKRLVENDKIDLKKLDEAERKPMYVTDDMFSLYKVDECVIMLCSIQENPLEYLCSILKE